MNRDIEVTSTALAINGIEHEDLRLLFDYWNRKRGQRFAPGRRDIDPADLVSVLPRILLFDVIDGGRDFRVRLAGTDTFGLHGEEITGRLVSEFWPPAFRDSVLAAYRNLIHMRQAEYARVDYTVAGHSAGGYHVLRLPLSEDGESVSMILIGENYGGHAVDLVKLMKSKGGSAAG